MSKTLIYNPSSAGSRTPFNNNMIPTALIDPSVSAAMNALPLPNLPGNLYINTTDVLKQNNDNLSGARRSSISRKAPPVYSLLRRLRRRLHSRHAARS